MPPIFGLNKTERLKSRKAIQTLFEQGRGFNQPPLRIVYHLSEEKGAKAGFSVSKRNFKRAVDRNRIKRLLREAYRLQKNELLLALETKEKGVHFFLTFTNRELPLFEDIHAAVGAAIKNLVKRVEKQ
jgi:ribonuclease P protein component